MKKATIFLAIFLFSAASAMSQEQDTLNVKKDFSKHQIHVYGSLGYASSVYQGIDRSFIHRNYSLGAALELKYAYFFTPTWGMSIGVGLSQFAAKGTLNIAGAVASYDDPIPFDETGERFFDLQYRASDLVEQQRIWALEIPLQAHYVHRLNERHGIFSGLGFKGYFPVSAKSTFPQGEGTLLTVGYEDFTDAYYYGEPHFGTRGMRGTPANVRLRPSVDIIADIGWIRQLSAACDFYLGIYGSYGLMDIRPQKADRKDFITPEHGERFSVNSLLDSDIRSDYNRYVTDNNPGWKKVSENWHRWQLGAKIGFHFRPGKSQPKQRGRGSDIDRSPIIIRDNVHIVYVYSVAADNFTPSEKDNVQALVDVLGNSKILFEIDKDAPKIDDAGFVAEAAEILNREQSLRLIIEGHTCDLGTEAHNRELALRRANAIHDLFIKQGVNPAQLGVVGYTVNDPENRFNVRDTRRPEQRVVIFRIEKEN